MILCDQHERVIMMIKHQEASSIKHQSSHQALTVSSTGDKIAKSDA